MSIEEANALLAGIGGQAAKFEQFGDTTKGIILATEVRNQTDFKTGKVKTYDDGNPMKQIVITLQTEERESEEDDGIRKLYAKGQMMATIRQASNAQLAVGGKLAIRYVSDGEARRGENPPKQYRAWYEAPSVTVPVGDDADDTPF